MIVLAVLGGFTWYQIKLNNAKDEKETTVSRIVKSTTATSNTISDTTAKTTLNTTAKVELQTLKTGTFGSLDPVHYAKGTARITQDSITKYLELGDDFATNPDGPDLYVWLVKKQTLGGAIGGVDTDPSAYISIGALEAKSGKQTYQLDGLDITDKDYAVVIWCKAFGVQFSNAVLK